MYNIIEIVILYYILSLIISVIQLRLMDKYNRKILRNMLKKQVGSNKIQQAWHYLQVTNWGRRTKNESRV